MAGRRGTDNTRNQRELWRILAQDEVTQSDETIETETMKNEAARKRHNGEQAQQIIVEKKKCFCSEQNPMRKWMRSLVEFLLDSKAETMMKGENEEQVVIAEICPLIGH
jgi:hypothetical protein